MALKAAAVLLTAHNYSQPFDTIEALLSGLESTHRALAQTNGTSPGTIGT